MGGIIQFPSLGKFGRFGNQLFQYAFARAYANSVEATLHTPPWVGQTLFEGINDPPCVDGLPTLSLDEIPNGATNINLFGYFQFAKAFNFYSRAEVRRLFTFKKEWVDRFSSIRPKIAAHIRRGDYTNVYAGSFCTIGEDCYTWEIERHGFNLFDVTWVREDRPSIFPQPGLEWLQDFFTLLNSEILFRANSTFSWWAGTLNNHKAIFSPVVEGRTGLHNSGVEFVLGNFPRCTSQPNTSAFNLRGDTDGSF